MRKTEQKVWDRFRKNMDGRGMLLERLENAVGSGRPDVDVLFRGKFTPVELKAVEHAPVRAATPLLPSGQGLNTDQLNWHLDWTLHGGRSLIIIGIGSRLNLAVEGSLADNVNRWTLEEMARAACAATWDEIAWQLGWRPK